MAHNKLRTFHLFAGAGGGILSDILLGHVPVGACEIEEYPRNVLLQRQRDGILPEFPIWDDVQTLDGKHWRGAVDVLAGGFPCQDISAAGRGAGITGSRSGLWKEYKRLIGEMRPKFVFAENSPLLRKRGLDVILADLSELGYNARWCVLGSGDAGGNSVGKRLWVLATPAGVRRSEVVHGEEGERDQEIYRWKAGHDNTHCSKRERISRLEAICAKPAISGSINEVAHRVDRLKAIGNGQDPVVAATARRLLNEGTD